MSPGDERVKEGIGRALRTLSLVVGAPLVGGALAVLVALLAQGVTPRPGAPPGLRMVRQTLAAWVTPDTTASSAPVASTSTPTSPETTPTVSPGGTPAPTTTTTTAPTPPTPRPNPCAVAALHLRCPALVMSTPFELHLDRTTMPGRVLLRASSSIDNHGSGPLELRAHRTGGHTLVYEAIYDRHHGVHLYRTKARLVFKYIPGERYEYGNVGAASYWKLQHAAAFQLWSIDSHYHAIELVRNGPKVDYCLRDLRRTHPSRASPTQPVYPACSQDPNMRRDVLGTSVGWSDIYPYAYPEQWIDVTGLRGSFAYVQIIDPDELLFDSDPERRVSEVYVELPSGHVLGHRVGVAAP